jgi:hypothetical protein
LVFDAKGVIYGTTIGGGNAESGIVFHLESVEGNDRWTEAILLTFGEGNEGALPLGSVTFGSGGDLYGTDSLGGSDGGGEVYELQRPGTGQHKWTYVPGYFFKGSPDGSYPTGSLIFDNAGKLYGTTQQSGYTGQPCGSYGCGTVFMIAP